MALRERFAEIVDVTDEFCDKHLNDEYREIFRKLAAAICQKESEMQIHGWLKRSEELKCDLVCFYY
jgi:hypothetical protein